MTITGGLILNRLTSGGGLSIGGGGSGDFELPAKALENPTSNLRPYSSPDVMTASYNPQTQDIRQTGGTKTMIKLADKRMFLAALAAIATYKTERLHVGTANGSSCVTS